MLGERDGSDFDIELVMRALAKTGVAIELNSSPLRLDIPENGARMAREMNVPVAIDSDAHSVRELGFLKYGIGIARRAWLGKEHVLTAQPLERIREHHARRAS
jgi:DNA polymerase (family 10)